MFRGLIVALAGALLALVSGAFSGGGDGQELFDAPDTLLMLSAAPPTSPTLAPTPATTKRGVLLAVPTWVRFGKQRSTSAAQQARNRRFVRAMNNARLGTVVYGDSIAAFHQSDPRAWDRHFGKQDAHLGMGGSTVPELAWRIMKGGELPRNPPRNAVFLIGINDVQYGMYDPVPMLEELLRWYASAFPSTRLYVHALLPTTRVDVRPTNDKYREMAARVGASFVDCGAGLDPADPGLFRDGLHPTRQGHDRILSCLRRELPD